jgi:hypothetical protein
MTDFIPKDYIIPQTSNYMKFQEGANAFRVLSPAVFGYEYWNNSNKPVRSNAQFTSTPDAKVDQNGQIKVSHFWAFAVYNYQIKKIQILQINQKGIKEYIQGFNNNPKWGNPQGYDIVVNKSGAGVETSYTVMCEPHTPVAPEVLEAYKGMNINLEALFSGSDPFALGTTGNTYDGMPVNGATERADYPTEE